jgi:hypothetical protein
MTLWDALCLANNNSCTFFGPGISFVASPALTPAFNTRGAGGGGFDAVLAVTASVGSIGGRIRQIVALQNLRDISAAGSGKGKLASWEEVYLET